MESAAVTILREAMTSEEEEDEGISTGMSVRGGVWNQHLPYAACIEAEAQQNFEAICRGFGEIISGGTLEPGLKFWCARLTEHIQLYKYSFSHTQHVWLVKTLFELFWLENIDPTLKERLANVIRRLIKKRDILPSNSLEIPWKPFFDLLKEYFFGKLRRTIGIHKQLGEAVVSLVKESRRFFPSTAASEILAHITPLLCPHDSACFQGVAFLSLLLPTDSTSSIGDDHIAWVNDLFDVWRWMSSAPEWDFAFFMLFARVAKDNPGKVDWEQKLPWIMNRVLNSFHLPVGSKSTPQPASVRLPGNVMVLLPGAQSQHVKVAVLLIHIIDPKSPDPLYHIRTLLEPLKAFLHPSNFGGWSKFLANILYRLSEVFARRVREESSAEKDYPEDWKIGVEIRKQFVTMIRPYVFLAQFSKSQNVVTTAAWSLRHLAYLEPRCILPNLMDRVYPALQTLTETHQTFAALSALAAVVRPLLWTEHYNEGLPHLVPLLQLTLPGIDPNDASKTQVTLHYLMGVFLNVYLVDCSQATLPENVSEEEIECIRATSFFEDWVLQFMDRIFAVLETMVPASNKRRTTEGSICEWIEYIFFDFFRQISPNLYTTALNKLFQWSSSTITIHLGKTVGAMCNAAAQVNPGEALKKFFPQFCDRALYLMEDHRTIAEEEAADDDQDDSDDKELLWCLNILSRIVKETGSDLLDYADKIFAVLDRGLQLKWKKASKLCGKMLRHTLTSLVGTYCTDRCSITRSQLAKGLGDPVALYLRRGHSPDIRNTKEVDMTWHTPSPAEAELAVDLVKRYYDPAVAELNAFADGTSTNKSVILTNLGILRNCVRVGLCLFPERTDGDNVKNHLYDQHDVFLRHNKVELFAESKNGNSIDEHLSEYRVQVKDTMHRLINAILSKCEDDTKVFKVVIKIIYHLLCVRGITETKKNRCNRSWSYLKRSSANLVGEPKQYTRAMLIGRVWLQHQRRMSKRRMCSPYDDHHRLLVADLVSLSLSSYAIIRKRAQDVLGSVTSMFSLAKEEVFSMVVPKLTVPVDEMEKKHQEIKGALYLLSTRIMTRFAVESWENIGLLCKSIAGLHANDRPSVQSLVNVLFRSCQEEFRFTDFGCKISSECLKSVANLFPAVLAHGDTFESSSLEVYNANIKRHKSQYYALLTQLSDLLNQSSSSWKFELLIASVAALILRENSDAPDDLVQYFVRGLASDNLRMRHLSLNVTSLLLAHCKLKPDKTIIHCDCDKGNVLTFGKGTASKLPAEVLGYREDNSGHCFKVNAADRPTSEEEFSDLIYVDKNFAAWNAWPIDFKTYKPRKEQPNLEKTAKIKLIESEFSSDIVKKHVEWFAQDNADGTAARFSNSRAELYKGFARNQGPAIILLFRDEVEQLLVVNDEDGASETASKQRCACEIVAGIIRGAKHWDFNEISQLWEWAIPLLTKHLYSAMHMSVDDFASLLRYCVYDRDPRRFYPLADLVFAPQSLAVDEGDTSFSQSRYLDYQIPVLEELSWRGVDQAAQLLSHLKPYLAHPYKSVRERLARCLMIILKSVWLPNGVANPSIAAFVLEFNNTIIKGRGLDVLDASTKSDRDDAVLAAKTLLKWCLLTYYEGCSPFFQPYLPEILGTIMMCPELSPEDNELLGLSQRAIGYISQAMIEVDAIESLYAAAIKAASDESWHVRERALVYLQVSAFRNLFIVPRQAVEQCLIDRLCDTQLEVQNLASITLSGLIRCGMIGEGLLEKLMVWAKSPVRKQKWRNGKERIKPTPLTKEEKDSLALRHAGMLGLKAYITAFPYTIPKWLPDVLLFASNGLSDPEPVKSCAKSTVSEFWRTHQDDKMALKEAFEEDQLEILRDLVIGYNYYA